MEVNLEDLIIAFRKAKADAYYENGHLSAEDFVFYESKLTKNLKELQDALRNRDIKWFTDIAFTGSYTFIPKHIELSKQVADETDAHIYRSNGLKDFELSGIDEIQFRIIGFRHSIHFHVLCSLWVDKVGYKLERFLNDDSCYGCRLRKPIIKSENVDESEIPDIQDLPSHFRKYIFDYKRWQKTALRKAKSSLENGEQIAILTTDIRQFYHRIDPSFLLEPEFLTLLGDEGLTRIELNLTKVLLASLKAWSDHVTNSDQVSLDDYISISNGNLHVGLPIALSASKVIANLSLIQFDRDVEENVEPIFYGRYVDDIILIIKDNGFIRTHDDFWDKLSSRFRGSLDREVDENENRQHVYNLEYSNSIRTRLVFPILKEKLFVLEPGNGELFLETVEDSMNEASSEWRMMPDPENDLTSLGQKIAGANSDITEKVSGFRKANGVSIKRMGFSIELRNMEVLVRMLDKKTVEPYLSKFFEIVSSQIISPESIFTYFHYYPRLLALTVSSENLALSEYFVKRLQQSLEILGEKCLLPEYDLMIKYCWQLLNEAILKSLNPYSTQAESFTKELEVLLTNASKKKNKQPYKLLLATAEAFVVFDLHNTPLKHWILDHQGFCENLMCNWKNEKPRGTTDAYSLKKRAYITPQVISSIKLSKNLQEFSKLLCDVSRISHEDDLYGIPNAFFFYTRPFNYLDITSHCPDWPYRQSFDFQRSFGQLFYPEAVPKYFPNKASGDGLELNDIDRLHKIRLAAYDFERDPTIAIVNLETLNESWEADVRTVGDPDTSRELRIFRLISQIMRCGKKIDYIVFPELSIPQYLLRYIAEKLRIQGISLIAGLTYNHAPATNPVIGENGYVYNELAYLLYQNVNGFGMHLLIRQNKSEPAIHEERELWNVDGRIMLTDHVKYLIDDRGYHFSGLICNELLSIKYRHQLLGFIDTLFVVEWNKDLDTYDPIVSATANDLHCFVFQVNNRKYGDTRVRAPYKDSWRRDVARVRGGKLDYFVVVQPEVNSLRDFQSYHRSPDGPFKPVPTGFSLSQTRRHNRFEE